jgi:tRNA threonylcarbamoyladenosine modification (KEOPS) complex  Pcc1 subunit
MDAKWNWLIDNIALRATINTAVFALWIAASIGILEIAAKL